MAKKELNAKQRQCIALLSGGEKTQKEIASILGVTEQTICNWKRDARFIAEFDTAVKGRIRYLAGRALTKQLQLLDSEEDKVAHWAASDLLDRAGFKASEKVDLSAKETVVFCGEDQIPD